MIKTGILSLPKISPRGVSGTYILLKISHSAYFVPPSEPLPDNNFFIIRISGDGETPFSINRDFLVSEFYPCLGIDFSAARSTAEADALIVKAHYKSRVEYSGSLYWFERVVHFSTMHNESQFEESIEEPDAKKLLEEIIASEFPKLKVTFREGKTQPAMLELSMALA